MCAMRGERVAYRTLLRVARKVDRNPLHLVTLLGSPPMVFDFESNHVVRQSVANCPCVEHAIWEACGNSIEFAHPVGRAAAAVRKHRLLVDGVGADYMAGARELLERINGAIRLASKVFSSSEQHSQATIAGTSDTTVKLEDEPRNLRDVLQGSVDAQSTRLAPDDVSLPSFGQFLIAHPMSVIAQPSLDQGVILLSEVDTEVGHVKGVALNMSARCTLRSMFRALSCRGADGSVDAVIDADLELKAVLEPLLDAPALLGGALMADSLSKSLTWLHTLGRSVPGAKEVAPSVWLGGDVRVMATMVASGAASLENIRPVIGYSGWSLQQLSLELKRGIWVRARTVGPEISQRFCVEPSPGCVDHHRVSTWRTALIGVNLPCLAFFPRGKGVDGILLEFLADHYKSMKAHADECIAVKE
eukprot:TRINITY_DN62271_c0_g1_i1.p1 TRINITY_DN62271_c0_g1~~TRINITY_DN62271_c0_g1_i1.p1  ORF type:complete len:417 (-),score=34.70 TRINITY_DN62271_c0_g1_i1:138-1388(-)